MSEIIYWDGVNIEEMTKEELLSAFIELASMHTTDREALSRARKSNVDNFRRIAELRKAYMAENFA